MGRVRKFPSAVCKAPVGFPGLSGKESAHADSVALGHKISPRSWLAHGPATEAVTWDPYYLRTLKLRILQCIHEDPFSWKPHTHGFQRPLLYT